MILVREDKQFARNLLGLEDVEGCQPLGDRQSVVKLAMDDLSEIKNIDQHRHTDTQRPNKNN